MYTNQQQRDFINNLYINTLGRDAVFGSTNTDGALDSGADADYWVDQLQSGTHQRTDLQGILQGSAEYKARDKFIKDYKAANNNVAPDEATIDANVGVGGVLYATDANPTLNLQDQYGSNTWLQNFGLGDSFAVNTNDPLADAKSHALAISNQAGTVPGSLITALTTGNGDTGDGSNGDGSNDDGSNGDGSNGDGAANNYLTSDDLTAWWDALDKSSFTGNQNNNNQQSDNFTQFLTFMTALQGLGGMFGGGGGGMGQYGYGGYGGFNPGGVAMQGGGLGGIMNALTAFQSMLGGGSGGATTNTLNTGQST